MESISALDGSQVPCTKETRTGEAVRGAFDVKLVVRGVERSRTREAGEVCDTGCEWVGYRAQATADAGVKSIPGYRRPAWVRNRTSALRG